MTSQLSAGSPPRSHTRPASDLPELRFEVLGPVRAWHGEAELDLGSPQQRAVLAVLLLSQGWQVSIETLIDALWGEDRPPAASGTVRTYISRLRRCLEPVTGDREAGLIKSIGNGYALPPDSVIVDVELFTRHVQEARHARDRKDPARAASLLREGLALWRGVPLAGVQGPYADSQRTRLAEVRMAATEDRLAMDIDSDGHLAAIAELRSLLDEHPLRERLSELLMLALYRAGRQADALSVFAGARRVLRDELGIDPGPGLRDMHERILRGDHTLTDVPTGAPTGPPAQMPPPPADFTGRADTLAAVADALAHAAHAPVVTITGMPGIGKTALAVQAARAAAGQFPDGQLYAELGAVTGTPAAPAAVLSGFLRALGHGTAPTIAAVPVPTEELTAACRATLGGRRMLVVLDDAHDAAQVSGLLPALRGCAIIVTTQRRMIELPAARWFEIAGLRPDESMSLLKRTVGGERLAAEPAAARRLITACAGQAIALRTAAARLAARPGWRVTDMVSQLEEELAQPVITHPDCELVEAPFELAYRRLTRQQAYAFRHAATSEAAKISVAAIADLMSLPENLALALLESIADVHLIKAGAFGSYHYDPLVKLYGRRKALEEDGLEACQVSRDLLCEHTRAPAISSLISDDVPARAALTRW